MASSLKGGLPNGVLLEALAADGRFDLIVTDQLMPGMTGAQLARHVRASAPDLPVLIVTGFAEMAGADMTAFPVLHKPFTGDALAHALGRLDARPTAVRFSRPDAA